MGTFKDSLKKWFFTNNSSAASSTARVALLDASGNPIGSDTMANLASVLGVARGRFTPSGQGDSYTISTYAGLLYVFDGSNGNAYLYLIHNGSVDEIFKGALNVNLSVERVDATHTRIVRTTASTTYISWTYINGHTA